MDDNPQFPKSKPFWPQQLADGVYAAIHLIGGGALGNAGIVDLGNRTLGIKKLKQINRSNEAGWLRGLRISLVAQ